MKTHLTIALATLFFCLGMLAQQGGGPEDPPIQAKLTGISLDRRISDLYLWTGREYKQVNFFRGVRSASVRYVGPREIHLYEKGETVEGEVVWKSIVKTQLLGVASDYLLILSKETATAPLQMFSIPEDLNEFAKGSYRFVNLTKKDLALKLGEERVRIRPLNFADVASDFEHGTSYESLLVELPSDEGVPELIYSSSLYYNERVRMLYLITPVGDSSKVKLVGIPQRI